MEALKILVFNWRDITHPQAGGSELHVHQLGRRWARMGNEVTLFTSAYPGCEEKESIDGIDIVRMGGRSNVYWKAWRFYESTSKNQKYDVILESINTIPFLAPIYAKVPVSALIYSSGNARVLFEELPRLLFPVASLGYLGWFMIPKIYRGSTTITISDTSRRELLARGMRENKVFVANPGLDEGFLNLVHNLPNTTRPNHRIVYLGRLMKYKGLTDLLIAIELASRHIPDIELLIIGRGDYEPRLRAFARRLGILSRVRFCGYVNEKLKVSLLKQSSIFVCLSKDEGGWTISALEALACGVPVLVTDSQRDIVVPGITGHVVPYRSPHIVADLIIQLIADPEGWRKMSRAARQFASQFTWEKTSMATLNALRSSLINKSEG